MLSAEMPRLLYVKEPAPDRQPELDSLLDRLRATARASYKSFTDAGELGQLLARDLRC